jgi:hypothetical protein
MECASDFDKGRSRSCSWASMLGDKLQLVIVVGGIAGS